MFAITDAHIDLVLDDLSAQGLMTDDLRNNLLDHICILAERDLGEDDDFETWYRRIIPTFYRQHLGEIEEETQFLLKHPKCFAVLDRLRFFLLLAMILLAPIVWWTIATLGSRIVTQDGIVQAWEAGLVYALFPVLLLIVLFLTPDRYDPLIPRGAKIFLGWRPFIMVVPPPIARIS